MHSEAYRKSIAVKRGSHNPHPTPSLPSSLSLTLMVPSPSCALPYFFFHSLSLPISHPSPSALTCSCTFTSSSSSSSSYVCVHVALLLSPHIPFAGSFSPSHSIFICSPYDCYTALLSCSFQDILCTFTVRCVFRTAQSESRTAYIFCFYFLYHLFMAGFFLHCDCLLLNV